MNIAALFRRRADAIENGSMTFPIVAASRTHVGRVRAVNEDRLLDRTDRRLWGVADGMGGHCDGAAAAAIAVEALEQLADSSEPIGRSSVVAALEAANRAIHGLRGNASATSGTTVVVLWIADRTATIAWAGDSRAYLVRDGEATCLTRDHSIVQDLQDAGLLTADAALRHPHANVVTRALGVGPAVAIDTVSLSLVDGDRILLCSDGLSRSLAPRDFAGHALTCDSIAERLLTNALQRDGSDNTTLIVIGLGL